MGENERKYVSEAFDSNWISPFGSNTDMFEQQLRNFTGMSNAISLSSGTAALHLALLALGVAKGDVVICQDLTFAASAFPINYVGAEPVFVDSETASWNMDPILLEDTIQKMLNQGKRIAAIVVVHLYGMPADMKRIMAIAKIHGIPVIEDAAEALGSTFEGMPCGSIGDIGIFSFNGNKIITTSGGGALLTNNNVYAEKIRYFSSQAREPLLHYEHKEIGYNYRMSNVLAGIGRGQMEVLSDRVHARRANFDFYKSVLGKHPGFVFLQEPTGCFSNRWLTTMIVDELQTGGMGVEKIIHELQLNNIESRPVWMPMHMQPVFKTQITIEQGIGKRLFQKGICLPSGSALTEDDLSHICRLILDLVK